MTKYPSARNVNIHSSKSRLKGKVNPLKVLYYLYLCF